MLDPPVARFVRVVPAAAFTSRSRRKRRMGFPAIWKRCPLDTYERTQSRERGLVRFATLPSRPSQLPANYCCPVGESTNVQQSESRRVAGIVDARGVCILTSQLAGSYK